MPASSTLAKRYLTKTRFALALQCPTKLRYADDARYANTKEGNSFLLALADSGHRVGALAKTLLGRGKEIEEQDHATAAARTAALLEQNDALLYEAAVRWENCFIRIDLLEKCGDVLRLYEVKAKSCDGALGEQQMFTSRGAIAATFRSYAYDVAFQRYVLRRAFPQARVESHLVFVDKGATAEDPAAQRMRLQRNGTRVGVSIDPSLYDGTMANALLAVLPADALADVIERTPLELGGKSVNFGDAVGRLMQAVGDDGFDPRPGDCCKTCEFKASPDELANGRLDGRMQCWATHFHIDATALRHATVLDLHRFRGVERLLRGNKLFLADVRREDINPAIEENTITPSHRQWLQCEESRGKRTTPWSVPGAIGAEMARFRYPLHFIDFETARPALPYHAGRRPYEEILFQFSHHRLDEHGRLAHAGEFLSNQIGAFPNYAVLRELKAQLGNDAGSVLHWWDHERNVLRAIHERLSAERDDVGDADELLAFVDVLLGTDGRGGRLFDLGRVFDRLVFVPGTHGSSSIKKILPALLAQDPIVREKYAEPIYGTSTGVPSHNFKDWAWVQTDDSGGIRDPYSLLGQRFADQDLSDADRLEENDVIAEGGSAMMAYELLESGMLSEADRASLRRQLLRYCELDTFAMVLAWEAIGNLQLH